MRKTRFITPDNRERRTRPRVWVVTLLILVLITGICGVLYLKSDPRGEQNSRDESQTISQKTRTSNKSSSSTDIGTDVPDTSVKEDVPNTDDTVIITNFSNAENLVSATAKLSSGDGECVFTYTTKDNDRPVIDSATSKNSICTSTLQANTQFVRIGDYNLNVTVYINNKKAEANQSVTIK